MGTRARLAIAVFSVYRLGDLPARLTVIFPRAAQAPDRYGLPLFAKTHMFAETGEEEPGVGAQATVRTGQRY